MWPPIKRSLLTYHHSWTQWSRSSRQPCETRCLFPYHRYGRYLVLEIICSLSLDKADAPLIAGRADGVQPRFLETLATWGLAQEVAEEGPLIERTAVYKDGKKLLFGPSHQSDSRYRGLHIITQGQVERIYIRDLKRNKSLVERSTTLSKFEINEKSSHPVHATLRNSRTGAEELVNAKFLVGSDGAASMVRKQLNIPFDGCSTDIYWGIMDCRFESDYPHAWVFGSVISSDYGGCVIIPREDGYIRYVCTEKGYNNCPSIDFLGCILNLMYPRLVPLPPLVKLKTHPSWKPAATSTYTVSLLKRSLSKPTRSLPLTHSNLPLP